MKNLLILGLTLLMTNLAIAQTPSNMPSPSAILTSKVGNTNITIKYSQPAVKGRAVWDPAGDLAPYGKVWRTGANNATIFEIDQDVTIEGKPLAAGKYSLFTIPGEKEWIIIFNKKSAQWGAYSYKAKDDALRVTVPAGKAPEMNERFTINVDNGLVNLLWENVKVGFVVK